MDFIGLIAIMAIAMVVMAWYATNSKRNKVLCLYTGKDKTDEEKWIGVDKGYVIFRGRKFDIVTRRITSFWLTRGIHWLFPTKVNCLKYSWYSRFPHDPDDYTNVWETPEARAAIDTSDLVKSYFRTSTPTSTKAASSLQQYLPWVAIGLVALVAFYFHTKMSGFGLQLDAVINTLNTITR